MAHKYFIGNMHAFTNKTVTWNFAIAANECIFLDLNEGADPCIVAYGAAISIHKTEELHMLVTSAKTKSFNGEG